MALAVLETQRTEWNLPVGHLSPSQCWLAVSCGECFRLKYVEGIPEPPSANLAIGSAVHAAVARQREYIMDGQYDKRHEHLRMAAFMDAASDSFDQDLREAAEVEVHELWPADAETDLAPHKDMAMKLARFAVVALAPVDRATKIIAVEQRVFGLGTPLDDHEAALMTELGIEPIFPFPFKAFTDEVCELEGERICKTDLKTSADSRKPDWWPKTQITLYTLPDWRNGLEVVGRIDQVTKNATPQYITHWLSEISDEWRQKVIELVMSVAEDVSAGRFRMRPSYSCTYSHGLPKLQVAVDGLGT